MITIRTSPPTTYSPDPTTDTGQFLFNWNYIEQRMEQESPGRVGQVGWWVIKIADPARAAAISKAVDAEFDNSSDETLTETEAAFQQSFVAMSGTIISSLQVMSILLIGVILLVAGNTIWRSARPGRRSRRRSWCRWRSAHCCNMA